MTKSRFPGNRTRFRQRRGGRQGWVLLATAASIFVIAGMLGLVIDLGRAFVVKNESQAFTDSAAMAAALQLNNTSAGVDAAKAAVAGSTNRWYFGTAPFVSPVVEFSVDAEVWLPNPGAIEVRYVRVTVPNNSVSVYFMTALGLPEVIPVAARSVAGIMPPTTYSQGVFPFAPFAHDPDGPNFGYSKGDELTLLWPSSVQSNGSTQKMNNLCQADQNLAALQAVQDGTTAERGYIQESSASAIAAAIEDDHMDYTVTLGQAVNRTGGVKTTDIYQSLNDRVNQDSSPSESDYDRYIRNHDGSPTRRVVVVPIISDANNAIVLGFAKVFLPPNQPHNPNKSKCAMYIGPADVPTGNDGSGLNIVRLLQ
ncbi:MAG: Tad domain-containing protein [Bryobacteraceae bacterium]